MRKKILIIGSGGREHALAWKIAQSPKLGKLYVAPGNGGTREVVENIPIQATDIGQQLTVKRNVNLRSAPSTNNAPIELLQVAANLHLRFTCAYS
jgi:phosphoribosylamine-glycine ligase